MVESTTQELTTLTSKLEEMRISESQSKSEIEFLTPNSDEIDTSPIEKILLTSYPRSGNTLIRTYLEKITRILTGSDCDIRRPLNR